MMIEVLNTGRVGGWFPMAAIGFNQGGTRG